MREIISHSEDQFKELVVQFEQKKDLIDSRPCNKPDKKVSLVLIIILL